MLLKLRFIFVEGCIVILTVFWIISGTQLDGRTDSGMAVAIGGPAAIQDAVFTTQSCWCDFTEVNHQVFYKLGLF